MSGADRRHSRRRVDGKPTDRSAGVSTGPAERALDRVADIADRARQHNLDRAGELADYIRAAEDGVLTAEGCEEAADVAHRLAGSAGTFGYFAATELARRIERTFLEGGPDDAEESVRELIRRLKEPPESVTEL